MSFTDIIKLADIATPKKLKDTLNNLALQTGAVYEAGEGIKIENNTISVSEVTPNKILFEKTIGVEKQDLVEFNSPNISGVLSLDTEYELENGYVLDTLSGTLEGYVVKPVRITNSLLQFRGANLDSAYTRPQVLRVSLEKFNHKAGSQTTIRLHTSRGFANLGNESYENLTFERWQKDNPNKSSQARLIVSGFVPSENAEDEGDGTWTRIIAWDLDNTTGSRLFEYTFTNRGYASYMIWYEPVYSTTIPDGSTYKAISYLNLGYVSITGAEEATTTTTLEDILELNENGDKFLANDGTYKKVESGESAEEIIAQIPIASANNLGLVKILSSAWCGLYINANGELKVQPATETEIKAKLQQYLPITPKYMDIALINSLTTNTNTLTDEEKTVVTEWLGALQKKTGLSQKNQVYVKTSAGVNTLWNIDADITANSIVRRDATGNIIVPLIPTMSSGATSKDYVDKLIADLQAQINEIKGE